jgi:hypothetical protein
MTIFDDKTSASATRSFSVTPATWTDKFRHTDLLVWEKVEIKLHCKSMDSLKVDHISY